VHFGDQSHASYGGYIELLDECRTGQGGLLAVRVSGGSLALAGQHSAVCGIEMRYVQPAEMRAYVAWIVFVQSYWYGSCRCSQARSSRNNTMMLGGRWWRSTKVIQYASDFYARQGAHPLIIINFFNVPQACSPVAPGINLNSTLVRRITWLPMCRT